MLGTVLRVKADRGFGFVTAQGQSRDIFFHVRDLPVDLPFDESLIGRRVTFEVVEREKGLQAIGIRPAN